MWFFRLWVASPHRWRILASRKVSMQPISSFMALFGVSRLSLMLVAAMVPMESCVPVEVVRQAFQVLYLRILIRDSFFDSRQPWML